MSRYQPRTLDVHAAAQAAVAGDLVPWREAAQLVQVKPATLARWVDHGLLAYVTINGRRHVSVAHASEVEGVTRLVGRPRP